MFLYLGGCWVAPMFVHTLCTFICPPYICMPPYVCTPPMGPQCSQCSCMVLEHYMLWGVVFLLYVYWGTPPLFGGASPLLHPPHSFVGYLCIVILRLSVSYVGVFPLLLKGLGVFPPSLGEVWGGTSALCCSHVHSYTFF